MLRWIVTAGFLGTAGLTVWVTFLMGAETPRGNLLINLGTEMVGIVITVAVVEWFFEKRRHNTRGRQLLNNAPDAVAAVPGFMNGLEQLARLSAMRDGKTPVASHKVADILDEETAELAKALGKPAARHLASLLRYRDPSLESQERPHFGGHGHVSMLSTSPSEPMV